MNHKIVVKVLGAMLALEGVALLLPTLIGLLDRDGSAKAFLLTAGLCFLLGVPSAFLNTEGLRMQRRDGFAAAGLCWILLGAAGALPYLLSGTVASYIDAIFETISGFTTTGATILTEIEAAPRSVLFWRAETNWLGGMGVLVLLLALLPRLSDGSANLMRAESPGPVMTKLLPRIADTAKVLYLIYIGLTAAETIVLCLLGLPLYDSVTNAFATIATGGFCIHTASVAFYESAAVTWTVTVFMFLSGINFSVLYLLLLRRFKEAFFSEELRFYVGFTLIASAVVAVDLVAQLRRVPGLAAQDAVFQVVSYMTTTGFTTDNAALWPELSQCTLLLGMLLGGCAGSTAGGIKHIRVLVLYKDMRRWLQHILHPREVHPVCIDGKRVEEETTNNIACFFFAYILLLLLGTFIISLENIPFLDAFTAALTSISNVGPAFGSLGVAGTFASLSAPSKLTMSICMLFGRLEIVPLLILLMPSLWRKA